MKHIFTLVILVVAISEVLGNSKSAGPITIPIRKLQRNFLPTALRKNNNLKDSLSGKKISSGIGTEKLKNFQSVVYVGTIEFGYPPQKVDVAFDTGSTLLWAISSIACRNKTYCLKEHNTYNHCKSKTYRKNGKAFESYYVTGEVRGFLSYDDVSVGGLQVKQLLFGEALKIDELFLEQDMDGIFGLSFAASHYEGIANIEPPFLAMINQNVVDKPVFAFYLTKLGSKVDSELTLGGYNEQRFTGEFTFTPVVNENHWRINVDKILVGDLVIGGPYYDVTVDSGSTAMGGPANVMNAINDAIGAKYNEHEEEYDVDCNTIRSLPNVTLVINNTPFTLQGRDYVVKYIDQKYGKICWSGFLGIEDLSHVILGVTFIQKFYTLYDAGQKLIGFAPAVH